MWTIIDSRERKWPLLTYLCYAPKRILKKKTNNIEMHGLVTCSLAQPRLPQFVKIRLTFDGMATL